MAIEVEVRPLRSMREIEDVLGIEAASFTNPWTREMHERDLEMTDLSHLVIARDSGRRALGFCSFWIVVDELHINNLAVLPEFRRHGIASRIIERVIRDAYRRGARRATLEVRRSNDPAIRLYERWGFETAGVRPDYYTKPDEDALILWRHQLADIADGPDKAYRSP